MSTKKKQENVLLFNKKNTLAFADLIFSDKGGVISLLKLCNGTLQNGKDGGRTLHCAVGEAYFSFVSRDMKKILNAKAAPVPNKYGGIQDYVSQFNINNDGPTAAVIDALVAKAQLKSPTDANKQKLATALDNAVGTNDSADGGNSAADWLERSEEVANVFRTEVAPLLK